MKDPSAGTFDLTLVAVQARCKVLAAGDPFGDLPRSASSVDVKTLCTLLGDADRKMLPDGDALLARYRN